MNTKEIREGKHNGKTVWICHYHRPYLGDKPLRCVPPTKVLVRSNSELPKNKNIYYSQSHFVVLNKKGLPLKKILSPVDNTGYRSRSGTPLFTFDNERDCEISWNEQIDEHLKAFKEYERVQVYKMTYEQNELTERKVYNFTCEDCGEKDDSVKKTVCPYQKDLYNEKVPVTLCDCCEFQRGEDI